MTAADHLVIAPILVPLLGAIALLFAGERRPGLTVAVSIAACLGHLVAVVLLAGRVAGGELAAVTYALGGWPAPFGIVLAADRLSVIFLGLTSLIGFSAFLFSITRWKRQGAHFAPLFQCLIMGLSGVFLTGDLFNLFVFFEVTLTASYGLALHGAGAQRVIAGLHYIVVNLVASLLFLIGATLFFGVAGSLNFADLAVRIPQASDRARSLLTAGGALLGVAFLIKAAAWPLGMWLPGLYGAAVAPVAAAFVLLTKVGIYAIMRLSALWSPGGQLPDLAAMVLVALALATMVIAMIGLLASRAPERMAGYAVILSSGTLLAAIGIGGSAVLAGALFYLVISSLASCAFFFLLGLLSGEQATRTPSHAVRLEPYASQVQPRFSAPEATRIVISRPAAFLGLVFLCCALLLAGAPPFSGFVAKLSMVIPMLALGADNPGAALAVVAIIASGLAMLAALSRFGMQVFWADADRSFEMIRWPEAVALLTVLGLALALAIWPEPALNYARLAAEQLATPGDYIAAVLPTPQVRP
jgi:multicomponent K+:H+ antiporter subunit D